MTLSVNPIDAAKEIIRSCQTAGLSKDVIDLMEKKLLLLTEQIAVLTDENTKLKLENNQLRIQVQNLHPITKPADTCPYCRRAAGEIVRMKPHPELAEHGVKIADYKCSHCGNTYDKQVTARN